MQDHQTHTVRAPNSLQALVTGRFAAQNGPKVALRGHNGAQVTPKGQRRCQAPRRPMPTHVQSVPKDNGHAQGTSWAMGDPI